MSPANGYRQRCKAPVRIWSHQGTPTSARPPIGKSVEPVHSAGGSNILVEAGDERACRSCSSLRYFIHDDFDALRMEISGSLVGMEAQKAHESWRSALFLARRTRLLVDPSHVTEAAEQGKAVLRAWQGQDARIIASSTISRAIANSIVRDTDLQPPARTMTVRRRASFFGRHAAGNPTFAERLRASSADAKESRVESIGFPVAGEVEQQVR